MKRYNVVVPRKYERNGEEKTAWSNVGTLVHFPATESKEEGFILELGMFPQTTFKIFPQEDRAQKAQNNEKGNVEDVPF